MKKILFSLLAVLAIAHGAFADSTSLFPGQKSHYKAPPSNLVGGTPMVVQGLQPCAATASNSAQAISNNAILQNALNAGGNIYIPVSANYCNSATLLIGNNTYFHALPGTIIKNIPGVNSSVIRNSNYVLLNGGLIGGANSQFVIENIIFDGNGPNETVAFCPVDFEGVNYVWFLGGGATGGLRTGTFPTVSQDGEGINFRDSQYFWVKHAVSYSNSYDGFKTRHSWDGHYTDIIAINNGRSGIQIAHGNDSTHALILPSERITVDGITIISATGIPTASSPTVSGVYFHGANHSTVTGVNAYGVQNCIGSDDGANYNTVDNVVCQPQNSGGFGALETAPSQTVTNTDVNNIISNVSIEPLSGASQPATLTNSNTSGNIFQNINFNLGGGSGTWTFTNAGAGNKYTNVTGANFSLVDTGTSTIFLSGYQGNGAKVQLSTGTTTTNDCVKYDANGNTVDAGSACGAGGSGITNLAMGAGVASTNIGGTTAITSTGTVFADASYFPLYLGGLNLSNDGTTPNTIIDTAAGMATSDDNTFLMKIAAFTKTTGSWSLGTAGGCLDTGSVAASTWYYHYVIGRTDTNVIDELCSISSTSPTMPTSYTKKRLVGAFKTDGSNNILAYTCYGYGCEFKTAVLDINTSSLGTTAALQTLGSVPPGIQVRPICRYTVSNASANSVLLTSPDATDVAPSSTTPFSAAPGFDQLDNTLTVGDQNTACPELVTNTSGQIRARATAASTTLAIVTKGWKW